MDPNHQFDTALRHFRSGQVAEAERICRNILEIDPNHVSSLHFLGLLAHRAGRNDVAIELIGKAIALNDQIPECHYNIGLAFWAEGRLQAAAAHYQRAVALRPNYAEAHNNLGNVLMARGDVDDAVRQYQRASALKPGLLQSHVNMSKALMAKGETAAALTAATRALAIQETPEIRALYAYCLSRLQPFPGVAQDLLLRALSEPWGRPRDLAQFCAGVIKLEPIIGACIGRATNAWPRRLSAGELLGPSGLAAVSENRLLRALMESAPVFDVGLERFLTGARAAMLHAASALTAPAAVPDRALGFYCALARQCFINEYVFVATADELERARQLRDSLAAALNADTPIPALWTVAVAAYFPLYGVPLSERLLDKSWPDAVTGVLIQQVREPGEERQLRASIPALTEIAEGASARVRQQYEENPYPTWVKSAPPGPPKTLESMLHERFPMVAFRGLGKGAAIDILIAGCGTGQHAVETAQQFPAAAVLAVDLSLTSLAYAKRKAREAGLSNIELAQADILKLGSNNRRFDLIEAVGVLHHLEDPWTGWRVLLSLLRPNGFMRLGFYSELARRNIVAARAFIAERGYGRSAEDIRQCRQDLLAQPDDTPLKKTTQNLDFFSVGGCRDLLFHVQEHRLTLPRIRAFLVENDLQFLGFDVDGQVLQQYRLRFPDDKTMTDLERWDAFEAENPDIFFGMYNFYIQSSGTGRSGR